jgi:hypothetical protein
VTEPKILTQEFPDPLELRAAVDELCDYHGWTVELGKDDEVRGQGCKGLTLSIYPTNPDSYSGRSLNTRFLYPVPAAAFNRESWEEWLWARIEETEGHERAEFFRFGAEQRRPFKPLHADGYDPGVIRRAVPLSLTNAPNAGRMVKIPCLCGHEHRAEFGEHFIVDRIYGCSDSDCDCKLAERLP